MAYLSFDFAVDGAQAPAALADPAAGFSATEWAVIRIAQADGIGTLQAPSRFGRFARRLFGLPAANRLADPRLEALRCAAVRGRLGRPLEADQVRALRDHGFGLGQIAALAMPAGGAGQAGLRSPGGWRADQQATTLTARPPSEVSL
jgi:hypothetical protein